MTAAQAPAKGLGVTSAAALVIANMVGAGVFTTSGFALADLGDRGLVLAAWVIGGGLALLGTASYAALARRMPQSGGEYHYLAQTVHPLAGFLAGWVSLLAGFTAPIAVAALALQAYLGPAFGVAANSRWIATLAIVLAFLMHGLRRRDGVLLQNTAVAVKLLLLAGFIAFGVSEMPALPVAPAVRAFDVGAFAVSLVWISFAYSGWNAAVYIASEVENPRHNAGRALWIGCTLVVVLYPALNYVFLYSAPVSRLSGRPDIAAVAARALGGDALWRITSSVIALALFTSVSAMVMAGPRVYARMAEDGVFPRLFARGQRIPTVAIALQSVLAIVVVWWTRLASLLGYVGFTLGLSSAAAVVGLLLVRRREGSVRVPIPGYPIVPVGYVATTLAAGAFLVALRPGEAAMGLVTVASGIPLYFLHARKRLR